MLAKGRRVALLTCLPANIGGSMAAQQTHGNIQHKDGCSHRGTNFPSRLIIKRRTRGDSPYLFFRATIDIDKQAAAFFFPLVVIVNAPTPLHVLAFLDPQTNISEFFRRPAGTEQLGQPDQRHDYF